MDAAERRAERQRIEEEAASFVVDRLARGDDPATAGDALRWAAQSPVHGVALAQAEAAWAAAERLRAAPPQPCTIAPTPSRNERRPSRRLVIGGGIAAMSALPLAVGVSRLLDGRRLETAIGQQRSFALGEGSEVYLNTDTVIDVGTRGDRQAVTLVRGEALFDLAATAARPLAVYAGTAVLNAFQSAFNLSLHDALTDVVVARGWVTVIGKTHSHKIISGNRAVIESGAIAVAALPTDAVRQRLAWRQGTIDLTGQTLAQATEEFNRYRQHPIIVADPSIASLRLGGTFATTDGDVFVDAVQRSFPIRAVRSNDGSVLLTVTGCSPTCSTYNTPR